jgi:hypothetical protein
MRSRLGRPISAQHHGERLHHQQVEGCLQLARDFGRYREPSGADAKHDGFRPQTSLQPGRKRVAGIGGSLEFHTHRSFHVSRSRTPKIGRQISLCFRQRGEEVITLAFRSGRTFRRPFVNGLSRRAGRRGHAHRKTK